MMQAGKALAVAQVEPSGMLVSADEPIAGLQRRCGGDLPGPIAVPALQELVQKAFQYGFKLARQMTASDGHELVRAWIEVIPPDDGHQTATIRVLTWETLPLPAEDVAEVEHRKAEIDRTLAELTAELDSAQAVRSVEGNAADLADLARAMRTGVGRSWTDFVDIEGDTHQQPLHWRLLDGARLKIAGSQRSWRARLHPRGGANEAPQGFELLLVADEPAAQQVRIVQPVRQMPSNAQGLVGRDVAPVLRQPIARIIANAETIRTRLAGPLAEEYSQYAADIAAAGQHLLALVDDLADLEIVESDQFNTAPDRIDLADVSRRAAGILAVKAAESGITIDAPRDGETMPAIAEFRRVLQILLNLVGNAIRYSPDNSQIWIRLEGEGARARVIVADQGPGIAAEQQAKVFTKFERLGRSDAAGSGLGLYISRRLARAMGGDLTVDSAPGQGARFTLDVPADLLALAPKTAQDPD